MLKTIKIPTIAPICFGSRRNHHQGAIQCLAKTTIMVLLCSSLLTWSMLRRHTSLLCKGVVHGRGRHCSAFLYRVYCVRNVVAHGDAPEGKWRGNWRMEWVASTLTRLRNVVYLPLLTLMRTPRLTAVDWTDSPADLNGLVRLGERRNLVSARVPSGSARALPH